MSIVVAISLHFRLLFSAYFLYWRIIAKHTHANTCRERLPCIFSFFFQISYASFCTIHRWATHNTTECKMWLLMLPASFWCWFIWNRFIFAIQSHIFRQRLALSPNCFGRLSTIFHLCSSWHTARTRKSKQNTPTTKIREKNSKRKIKLREWKKTVPETGHLQMESNSEIHSNDSIRFDSIPYNDVACILLMDVNSRANANLLQFFNDSNGVAIRRIKCEIWSGMEWFRILRYVCCCCCYWLAKRSTLLIHCYCYTNTLAFDLLPTLNQIPDQQASFGWRICEEFGSTFTKGK